MSPVHPHSEALIRVLLVDACELVRKGVRVVLAGAIQPPIQVVAEANTGAGALMECERHQPELVVLEATLPDMTGLELCTQIAARYSSTRLLVLTAAATQGVSYEAVVAGAHGCLGKDIRPDALIDAIYDIASGGSVFDGAPANPGSRPPFESKRAHLDDLSAQQRRVLELLTAGHTNEEIAAELHLSKHTVRNYLVATFRKLGVKRRAQASALFMQQSHHAALLSV